MRKIFKEIHTPARRVFVIGWIVIAAVVAASAVLYIGAGRVFDYYSSVEISEKMLASARPASIGVCVCALCLEYRAIHKKNSSN